MGSMNIFAQLLCVFEYKLKRAKEKVFQPALGCVQHPKAVQNTQHLALIAIPRPGSGEGSA